MYIRAASGAAAVRGHAGGREDLWAALAGRSIGPRAHGISGSVPTVSVAPWVAKQGVESPFPTRLAAEASLGAHMQGALYLLR